jgi:hypothetical protein
MEERCPGHGGVILGVLPRRPSSPRSTSKTSAHITRNMRFIVSVHWVRLFSTSYDRLRQVCQGNIRPRLKQGLLTCQNRTLSPAAENRRYGSLILRSFCGGKISGSGDRCPPDYRLNGRSFSGQLGQEASELTENWTLRQASPKSAPLISSQQASRKLGQSFHININLIPILVGNFSLDLSKSLKNGE